jgi:hypothetical protein
MGHRALIAREFADRPVVISGIGYRQSSEAETCGPAIGAPLQRGQLLGRGMKIRLVQQLGRLVHREAHVVDAQLAQRAGGPQSRNGSQGTSAGQDEDDVGGTVADQDIQTVHHLRAAQFVRVIQDQPNGPLQLAQCLDELGEVARLGGGPPPRGGDGMVDRYVGACRNGAGNCGPQPSWIVVIAVQIHPGRHHIGAGAHPVREQRGLAESRRCAHRDDITCVVQGSQQSLSNDDLVRDPRRGDLGPRHRCCAVRGRTTCVGARWRGSVGGLTSAPLLTSGPDQAACH